MENEGFQIEGYGVVPEEVILDALLKTSRGTGEVLGTSRAVAAIADDNRTPSGVRDYLNRCLSFGIGDSGRKVSIGETSSFSNLYMALRERVKQMVPRKPD